MNVNILQRKGRRSLLRNEEHKLDLNVRGWEGEAAKSAHWDNPEGGDWEGVGGGLGRGTEEAWLLGPKGRPERS